jgi:predicted transcriptional regulator YheO
LVRIGGTVRPYGAAGSDLTSLGPDVTLPGSREKLRLEIDARRVRDAQQTLHVLVPEGGSDGESPTTLSFTHLESALDELLTLAESEIGRPINEMGRADRQRLVRFLDVRGAFGLRKAVERVADALGVSRFTVYNYLGSVRSD